MKDERGLSQVSFFLPFSLFPYWCPLVPAPFRKNGILTILSLPINEQSYYYAVPLCIFGNFPCTKVCFFLNYYIDSSFILTGVNMSLHLFTFNWMRGMPFPHSSGTRFRWSLSSWRGGLCCGVDSGPLLQSYSSPHPASHEGIFLDF